MRSRVLRVAIVASVIAALALAETQTRSGVLWRLITFTYQANVLAAAFYAWTLVAPKADQRAGLRGAVVLYVVVAGLIWNVFLVDASMGYTPANVLLHIVVPALALIDWMVVGHSQGEVRWWQPWAWLVYPALYGALAVAILNNLGRRAPYYFLDPGSVGAPTVIGNVAVLAVGFLALGYLLSMVGRASVKARF